MDNDNPTIVTIQLSKGYSTIVSAVDAELNNVPWHATIMNGVPYAHRNTTVLTLPGAMHRTIMARVLGRSLNVGEIVDHKNGNTLDNTRDNLRIATVQQNLFNSAKRVNNISGYKGVSFHKANGRWQSQIMINHKIKFLGYFDDPKEAHEAYCKAAELYFGEFARKE